MRVLFAGNPAIAVPSLAIAAGTSWTLAGVLTNSDSARGRSGKKESSDIARAALSLGVPVLKFDTLKTEAREAAAALKADLLVSFAYGRIFGPKFLALFPLGGINIHPSLLPKYRGPSPIQEAIFRRDTYTGVSIQRLAAGMDEGDILLQTVVPLDGRETTASLSETAARAGARLLNQFLSALKENGTAALTGQPQQGEPSYCTLLNRARSCIDWNQSALDIDAQIRACTPWPAAHTAHNGKVINILRAMPVPGESPRPPEGAPGQVLGKDRKFGILIQTGDGVLAVSCLQYQTKKALPWQAFLNGARDFTGSCLQGGF
ncbi:MAG: methionyl-tRNA formyltransferase [Treponema sp.]|jgi:methionyl-tRNA formyltransferase|nr:methionyl-tRNA formyltransferase [Treponema sp.]